jgi:hypothetical protein
VRSARLIALVLAAVLLADEAPAAETGQPGTIAVVVGRASRIEGVTLDVLRDLYLRRIRVWPDGSRVLPVNLPADAPLRETFSKRVLGRPPRELASYWNRRWFEGIQPPLVLRTPEAVCAYVGVEPNAIGYVPLADVDRTACRALLVLEETPR